MQIIIFIGTYSYLNVNYCRYDPTIDRFTVLVRLKKNEGEKYPQRKLDKRSTGEDTKKMR